MNRRTIKGVTMPAWVWDACVYGYGLALGFVLTLTMVVAGRWSR